MPVRACRFDRRAVGSSRLPDLAEFGQITQDAPHVSGDTVAHCPGDARQSIEYRRQGASAAGVVHHGEHLHLRLRWCNRNRARRGGLAIVQAGDREQEGAEFERLPEARRLDHSLQNAAQQAGQPFGPLGVTPKPVEVVRHAAGQIAAAAGQLQGQTGSPQQAEVVHGVGRQNPGVLAAPAALH